jgi:polyisoprenoid-binding protein YceI
MPESDLSRIPKSGPATRAAESEIPLRILGTRSQVVQNHAASAKIDPQRWGRVMRYVVAVCAVGAVAGLSQAGFAADESAAIKPAATVAPAGAYALDKAHGSLLFRVSHLGFSNFTARFTHFDVKLQFDPVNPVASHVDAVIDPRSIDSDNPPAGFLDMLRGPEWLDAARFPEIRFRSTAVELTGPDTARLHGDLSLHGVTRPVSLDSKFNGGYAGHPLDPHARIGFSAHGVLKRSEFGIAFGVPAPGSTMGVGDEVEILIEAELSGPALAPPPPAQ